MDALAEAFVPVLYAMLIMLVPPHTAHYLLPAPTIAHLPLLYHSLCPGPLSHYACRIYVRPWKSNVSQ